MARSISVLFGRAEVRTSIVGDKVIRAALKKLGNNARRSIIVPAMEAAMHPMYLRSLVELPKDSGLTVSKDTEHIAGKTKGRIIVTVGVNKVPYAANVELGTKRIPASHALQRTFDSEKANAVRIVESKIKAGVDALIR